VIESGERSLAPSIKNLLLKPFLGFRFAAIAIVSGVRRQGIVQINFWFVALVIGLCSGFASIVFRKGIETLQNFLYGDGGKGSFLEVVSSLDWYWLVLIPMVGGLIVGLILDKFTPDARARSVADTIEDSSLNGSRVSIKEGIASSLASLLTLGSGGSSGREGPVVHMASVISS
jgi:CIC family chloride channel protein